MPKVSGHIPNLVNGVSQQAVALRLPSQADASSNFYPTVVDGLSKRPRTDWMATLLASFDPDKTFTHIYIRDKDEQYVALFFDDGSIRVFDFFGDEKPVTNEGVAYLTAGSRPYHQRLRALTIADTTLVVNRDVEVTYGGATSPTRPYEALFYVQAGNYAKTYSITVNGAVAASYQTPDSGDVSHEPYVDTTYIANQLFTAATGLTSAPWAKGRYGSVVYVRNADVDFTCSMQDGYGGRASKSIHTIVQRFADLPSEGPDGFVVKVAGANGTEEDDYWVELNQGVWKECLKPGARLGLSAATMPHRLIRNADGSFTFSANAWGARKAGDEETVPDPSFVGNTIQDVFFYKNRLGFLTEQNTVLSESGNFYNFYRPTLTTTLDTDPIDVAASHTRVSLLKHMVILQGELLLFSEQTQFKLKGNDTLTPRSVSCTPLTEYIAAENVRPVASASNAYFVAEQNGFAQLYEMYLDKARETGDAAPTTSHCPFYLPTGVNRMIASPDLNLVFLTSRAEPGSLYVYKYHFQGNEKVQSAWQRWSFPGADRIVDMVFDNKGSCILLLNRQGKLSLEQMRCEQRINDTPLPFQVGLDMYHKLPGSAWSYDEVTDRSTITIPYDQPVGLVIVSDFGGPRPFGVDRSPENRNLDNSNPHIRDLVVAGDWQGQPVVVGVPYESRHRLSPLYAQSPDRSGKKMTLTNGRTQVYDLHLSFSTSGYFRVEVEPEGREKRIYPVTAGRMNSGSFKYGEITIGDGRVSVPVLSRNDRVIIELVNDSWLPSTFSMGEWRGTFSPTNREQ